MGFKYWAFISYSHQDRVWADWLHKTLEAYRVPKRLAGRPSRDGEVPRRLFPIFRDRDELPSSANLGDVLNESLRQSRYQIVICSPRSAASRWVGEEIKYFKSLGREDRVLCLIVDGEPYASAIPGREAEECFASALRFRVDAAGTITLHPAEPIAADARDHADGRRGARLKLLSGLLGVGLDELIQRERQRQFWQKVQIAAGVSALLLAAVSGWQWFEQQRQAREREIVIEKLVESGRQELLAGYQARAAVYLNEAYRRGEDSEALRFMLAQAMKPVEALTDIRVRHGGVASYRTAFSPDGKSLAVHALVKGSGQQSAVIKLFAADTGVELSELGDAPAFPVQLRFLPDGRRLMATGYSDDNRAGAPLTYLWSIAGPRTPLKIPGIHGIAGLNLHPDGRRVLAVGDEGLGVYDAADAKRERYLFKGRRIQAASFSPDGEDIAVAFADGSVGLYSLDGHLRKRLAQDASQNFVALLFTPAGHRVIGLSDSGDLRVWEAASGSLALAMAADAIYVSELQLDAAGQRLLTVGSEGYKVWSMGRGVLLFALNRTLTTSSTAALSPDGAMLVTADFLNKTSEVWDIRARQLSYSLDLHSDGVSSAAFDADGNRLLLASRDGMATLWRMPVRPVWQLESFDLMPRAVRFDPRGKTLLAGGGDYSQGRAELFDVASGRSLQRYEGHEASIVDVRFSADASRLLTASLDGTVRLWDRASGKELARMNHNLLGAASALFSPAGDRILTTTDNTNLGEQEAAGVWDAESGRHVAWLGHSGMIICAAFDPAGRRIATGGTDGSVRVWDAEDGGLLQTLTGHVGIVSSVQFSADGRRILTAGHDASVRIWALESGESVAEWADPAIGLVTQAAYAPDESQVAVATQSGDLWIWEPKAGAARTLKGHLQRADEVRYSRSGALLFSRGWDGTVRAWDPDKGLPLGVVSLHPRELYAFDHAGDETRMVSSAWGQFTVTDVAIERRPAEVIASILSCKSPWSLDVVRLGLDASTPAACR